MMDLCLRFTRDHFSLTCTRYSSSSSISRGGVVVAVVTQTFHASLLAFLLDRILRYVRRESTIVLP